MFLNNQKYWAINYKYSDELGNHLQSIKSFLSNLIITNHEAFKIIDISKDRVLNEEEQSNYNNGENLEEIVNIYISSFTNQLTGQLQDYIDVRLVEEVSSNKYALFSYKKKIFYTKRRADEDRTIVAKIDGILKREIQTEDILKNKILNFWQQYVNDESMGILKVFMEHRVGDISLILDDGEAERVDFLPVKLEELTVEYDELLMELSKEQLKTVNQAFDIALSPGEILVSEGKTNNDVVGLAIGEYLFIYNVYSMFKDEADLSKEVKLQYLKNSILKDDSKKRDESEKIDEFIADLSNDNLIKSLKSLKNNLYIENDFESIDDEIREKYYRVGYMVESDYVKHNQFFIPDAGETDSLFGLHNNSNARDNDGKAEKGLKSWISSDNKEQNTGTTKEPTKAKKIMHLLPNIAFYFKEKFFEDYLEKLLNEIKEGYPELKMEIIVNKVFYINTNGLIKNPLSPDASFDKLQEFDFIVSYNKEDGIRITIAIEAKTKLSKFIIQDQADKVEKYMQYDDLDIFDKYFLVGFNVDKTVETAMAYFINNLSIADTSGLGFKYPLPTTDNVLYCTASNDRETLKNNLLTLFSDGNQKKNLISQSRNT